MIMISIKSYQFYIYKKSFAKVPDSPDDLSYKAMRTQNKSMASLVKLLKKHSIETAGGGS